MMKCKIPGVTHHATKTVQRLKDGGTVTPAGKPKPSTLQMERMPDGSQQYVRGPDRYGKAETLRKVNRYTADQTLASVDKAIAKPSSGNAAAIGKAGDADGAVFRGYMQNSKAWENDMKKPYKKTEDRR